MRRLRLRLLGDRVLQSVAWDVADQLGWPDTYDAEYVALTRLQADALVTLDERLAQAAKRLVPVASIDDLTGQDVPDTRTGERNPSDGVASGGRRSWAG